jgi:SAM-dependent methyltransferase
MAWNPAQYRKFSGQRLRPARDLLGRVPLDAPQSVVDLGCGEGAATRLLRERWPGAELTGVDSSAEMLEVAARELSGVQWEQADIATWKPPVPVDLIFSNAALHWLDDHTSLFLHLVEAIKPGGVMAVQMPRNFLAPSHTLITAVALDKPWRERLAPSFVRNPWRRRNSITTSSPCGSLISISGKQSTCRFSRARTRSSSGRKAPGFGRSWPRWATRMADSLNSTIEDVLPKLIHDARTAGPFIPFAGFSSSRGSSPLLAKFAPAGAGWRRMERGLAECSAPIGVMIAFEKAMGPMTRYGRGTGSTRLGDRGFRCRPVRAWAGGRRA